MLLQLIITNINKQTSLLRLISGADDDHHWTRSQPLPAVLPLFLAFGVRTPFFHSLLPARNVAKFLLVCHAHIAMRDIRAIIVSSD